MSAAGDDEESVVGDRRWGSETHPVAQPPDDRAGHNVEGGERAVAAREIDELSRSLHPRSAARAAASAAPRPSPSRFAAGQVDRDEVVLAFGDDDELGQAGEVNDRAGDRA